ncbi:MAG: hypothetical protein SGILL_007324 [Bacillariaceae sp.]
MTDTPFAYPSFQPQDRLAMEQDPEADAMSADQPPPVQIEDHSSDDEVHNDVFHDEGSPKNDEEEIVVPPSPSSGSHDGDQFEDDHSGDKKQVNVDVDIDDLQEDLQKNKISVISNVVFVIASAIYLALEVTILPYYRFYKDVPVHIREDENDDVWWNYYNETGAFPDWLLNADDDLTWERWFDNSFLDEEEELGEFLFQVPNADEKYEFPDEDYAAWVSQYMMLYFVAALGFLVTGILEVYTARGHFWSVILYTVMIIAAIFGIVSSMYVNKDPWISLILNAVSVHLFALEAIALIIQRSRTMHNKSKEGIPKEVDTQEPNLPQSCGGLSVLTWLLIGDVCFFIGTTGDVVLSYYYLLEKDYVEHAGAAIGAAVFWLLAALFYLGIASFDLHNIRRYFKDNDLKHKQRDVWIVRLIILLLVGLAAIILALGLVYGYSEDEAVSTLAPTDFATSGTFSPTGDGTFDIGTFNPSEVTTGDTNATFVPTDMNGTMSPTECMMEMSEFSQTTVKVTFGSKFSGITTFLLFQCMDLTLIVQCSISQLQYAANVFAKSFDAVSMEGFCDPYCHHINSVDILSSSKGENDESSARQGDECTEQVELVFGVAGTYWACPDEMFPRLSSDSTMDTDNIFAEARQAMPEETSCPACPPDSVPPSPQDYADAMAPFVKVMGPVCDLVSMEVVDLEGDAAATP